MGPRPSGPVTQPTCGAVRHSARDGGTSARVASKGWLSRGRPWSRDGGHAHGALVARWPWTALVAWSRQRPRDYLAARYPRHRRVHAWGCDDLGEYGFHAQAPQTGLPTSRFSVLRMTVHGWPCWCINPAQSPVLDGDGPRYTYMNETRNETNRWPRYPWRGPARASLTFRFRGGASSSRDRPPSASLTLDSQAQPLTIRRDRFGQVTRISTHPPPANWTHSTLH